MSEISAIFPRVEPIRILSPYQLAYFDPDLVNVDLLNAGSQSYSTSSYTIHHGAFDIEAYKGSTVTLTNGTYITFTEWSASIEINIYNINNVLVFGPSYVSRGGSTDQGQKYIGFALGQAPGYSNGVAMYWSCNLIFGTMTITRPTTELNDAILPNVQPQYSWKTWPQLAGNSGQYLLDLAQIQTNMIGDGTPAVTTQDGSIFTLPQQSLYIRICGNLQEGVEQTVMYCGDNYATATRRSSEGTGGIINVYITYKFYFRSGILAYTSTERNGWRENLGSTTQSDRYFGIMYDSENEVADMNTIAYSYVSGNYVYNVASLHSEQEMHQLWIWLQDNGETHEHGNPYDTGSEDNGGDPGQPRPQDNIPDSTLPTTSGLELGFVTLYKPTVSQLQSIASFLWSDNVLDNFKKYFNNFADNILSLYVLPFSPTNLSTKTFKVGQMTSEITGVEYCTARYYDVDMGSVQVLPRWDSCLDYNPYTKIQIFLPYLGLHSLDIDEIMSPTRMDGTLPAGNGSTLTLKYRLDILTGVIVAKISINGNVKYQFEGKVGASIPLTGQTYATMAQGIVQAGAGVATTIASGGLTAPLTAAAAVTGTVNASKATVERVGNISGDASLLALDYPYIILSSPNKPMLEQQEDYTGFPSYKSGTIGSFSGYTEVIQAHVEGISCTEEERTMILNWLKEGVII